MDESRKAFESWLIENDHRIDKDQFGKYVFSYAATTWVGWQTSRAAIEIELPKRIGSKSSWQEGPHMFADDVVSSIRAAGIKVKE